MHESPRRSNHLQRRLPKGEDRLKSAKHQGTNQPKRCGTEFNRQPQKRLRCVHNLGYRQLAKTNPATYQLDVALALNNLAGVYSLTQRLKEAEADYREALDSYRQLAK